MVSRAVIPLCCATLASAGAAPVVPERVLATFDSGAVTAQSVRDRWWLLSLPDPIVLETLLTANEGSPDGDVAAALASEVEEAGLDLLCLTEAEREGWDADGSLTLRAHLLLGRRWAEPWREQLESELPEPREEETAPHLARVRAETPATPERRSGDLLFLPWPGETPDDETRAAATRARRALAQGAEAAELTEARGAAVTGFGPMTRGEAPWREAGEVIFAAPEDGTPVLVEGEMGCYIVRIGDVTPMQTPAEEALESAARQAWRAGQARARQSEQLQHWLTQTPIEFHGEAISPEALRVTVGGIGLTGPAIAAVEPRLATAASQEIVDALLPPWLIAAHLAELVTPEVAARQARAARAVAARSLWEERVTVGLAPSPELMRALHEAYAREGVLRLLARHRTLVVRIMPGPHGEEPTRESLARLRGLDAEAERVREALAAGWDASEELVARVRAWDASSEWTVEVRDLGWLETPPAFLPGRPFFDLQAGETSAVVAPRQDVRLIYVKTAIEPERAQTFAEAEDFLANTALARQRTAALREAAAAMRAGANWRLALRRAP